MASGYGNTTDAATYHAERGNTAWADISSENEAIARLRGSEYIDGKYRSRFYGQKTDGRDQEREWPRENATDKAGESYDNDVIPIEILHASYEAALREHTNPGGLEPDVTMAETVKSESVHQAITTTYGDVNDKFDRYPVLASVERILNPLLKPASSNLSGTAARG